MTRRQPPTDAHSGLGRPAQLLKARAAATLAAAVLLGAVPACSSSDTPAPASTGRQASSEAPDTPPESRDVPSQEPRETGGTKESEEEATAALPEPLVGDWESNSDTGSATIAYRFITDGRYTYAGVLQTAVRGRPGMQVTFAAEGAARTEDGSLLLTPSKATRSLHDPDDPAADYTDQPSDLTPTRFQWEVEGDTLSLTDENGQRIQYERQTT
ncbi:hypothetical protein ACIRJS_05280 [Streptomyces sp. NPDC102340]|uniref:hypothetical protein n=1 Tax=unclassified Streptomyces TaxID=2593676 RepID=UPI0037F98C69